ncbi:MAG: hypothetical protein NC089_01515 [Bacteroides sp.]|nr:hypothetical protein [Bacteroides sp.]MCM1548801.1 hypothetical protein [Clostridium sp.]
MLKLEFYKAIRGKGFLTSLVVGIIFCILHAFWAFDYLNTAFFQVIQEERKGAYFTADPSFLQGWMGMDVFSFYGNLFYLTLFPILAALPYGASLLREEQLGYEKQVLVRSGKRAYFMSKLFTAFLTGGIVVTVPVVLSLGIAMSYLPLIPLEQSMAQVGVNANSMWSNLFYQYPLVYVLLYIMLDFLIAGIFAVLSLTICWRMKNAFLGIVLPTMLNFVLVDFLNGAPGMLGKLCPLVPYIYIHPAVIGNYTGTDVIAGLLLIILGTGCVYGICSKREDILS